MQGLLLKLFARLIVVCTTLPIHEFAHGWVAYRLGDDTAMRQGRLNLNPIIHIDPMGGLLILLTGFGWARPVPIDPSRFRKCSQKTGMALTAAAGPAANLLLALVLMTVAKLLILAGMAIGVTTKAAFLILIDILLLLVRTNIALAVFNLLPLPPLDGYSILSGFLPSRIAWKVMEHRQIIFIVVMVACFSGWLSAPIGYLSNGVYLLFHKMTSFLG